MERHRLQLPGRRLTCGVSVALSAAFCSAAIAEPEIHRCEQPDGTIAFQETPCTEATVEPAPTIVDEGAPGIQASGDDFFDFVNPYDQGDEEFLIEETPVPSEPPLPPPVSQDRAECEKITRDAIDAVDLEMRRGYDAEDGERYKAELLALTRQLRACKQL